MPEYFLKDFANALSVDFTWQTGDATPQEIAVKVGQETYSGARFVAYYIPKHPHWFAICQSLLENRDEAIKKSNGVVTISGFVGDHHLGLIGSNHCIVANRVYVYAEDELSEADAAALDAFSKTTGMWLTVRASEYVRKKMELEKPLAFISHDSRDKVEVAGPIAVGLQKLMCPVWYDEFSLKVGDHLRESIERGLKETKKCFLLLSPNFFSIIRKIKNKILDVTARIAGCGIGRDDQQGPSAVVMLLLHDESPGIGGREEASAQSQMLEQFSARAAVILVSDYRRQMLDEGHELAFRVKKRVPTELLFDRRRPRLPIGLSPRLFAEKCEKRSSD